MKEQPKDKFPIIVKKGHASVKIYRVKNRGAVNYCVSYVSPTGRQRKNFANLDLAKREASNVAQHLADGDIEALNLTGREKQIYVEAERAIAGTGLPLNLLEWLAPFRVKSGPIFDIDPRKRIAKIVKAAKVKWKRNALRHSFGSYRMEQTKNEGQVALEMGNSPKVVKDHYFEIVDERAARDYWSIKPLPKSDRKIVAIA